MLLDIISNFFTSFHLYKNAQKKRRQDSHDSNDENGGQGAARKHSEMLAHVYAGTQFSIPESIRKCRQYIDMLGLKSSS